MPSRPVLKRFIACSATLLFSIAGCQHAPRTSTSTAVLPAPLEHDDALHDTATAWFRSGGLRAGAQRQGDAGRARNLILFLGDGMSLTTVAAARIMEGQRRGRPGEENALAFEKFPHTALAKTYNTDSQTPDSAGTMTALMSGAKTRRGAIGVGQDQARGDCASDGQGQLVSTLELAEAAGLATGIVTTARLTHATPAATYAHVSERNWETDAAMPEEARAAGCRDIALQFLEFAAGDGIDVAMGGGRRSFVPATTADAESPEQTGKRGDGRNLISEWQQRHPDGIYISDRAQFDALDPMRARRVLALFEPGHMRYEYDRPGDVAGEPSLADMTRKAIAVLARDSEGFLLIVEGGRIDHAHHAGNAFRALSETIAFSDAVAAAASATSAADTLIVVTADHAHTLTFAGYPLRGNPILGKVSGASTEDGKPGLAVDGLGLPYTTLAYANGPGYAGASDSQPEGPKRFEHRGVNPRAATGRPDLTGVDTTAPDYLQEAPMPMRSETHGGEDVGVWARGPGAAAVRGTIEQNVVFHLMIQAQPRIVALLCERGFCERGLPVRLPAPARVAR